VFMPVTDSQIYSCLDELDAGLFRAGAIYSQRLRDGTQLSAVIYLCLRSSSLFRAMISIRQANNLDAFDACGRALMEAWYLGFEFRIVHDGQARRIREWYSGAGKRWKFDLPVLLEWAPGRGITEQKIRRDYGDLSELSHPMVRACVNSASLACRRLGIENINEPFLLQAIEEQS
jgi:hypothetical protein